MRHAAIYLAALSGASLLALSIAHTHHHMAPASAYSYRHVEHGCLEARVGLASAYLSGGHVAAWLGVDDGHRWIQAGVEQSASPGAPVPLAYVEVGHELTANVPSSRVQILYIVPLGKTITVRLVREGLYWQVSVDGQVVEMSTRLGPKVDEVLTGESLHPNGPNSYAPILRCTRRS